LTGFIKNFPTVLEDNDPQTGSTFRDSPRDCHGRPVRAPVQLPRDTRHVLPASAACGTASVFLFTEPLSGWRDVRVRPRRTKVDWATEVAELLGTRYAEARRVLLVCDNLNKHTTGSSASTTRGPGRTRFTPKPKGGRAIAIALGLTPGLRSRR